jgi:asparagine synthase (glutamine-hydrolysing)
MCGIYGEVSFRPGGVDRELLHMATEAVRHRGPDGFGYLGWEPDGGRTTPCREARKIPGIPLVAFGHRRLSIIDLSEAASQPMGTPEGDLWITYNGEIYNYIELREGLAAKGHVFHTSSDTEVILHAYREWGEECLHRFNGMWAFGLLDLQTKRLFCARDRMGVKPFYYHCDGKRFLFGSEIKQFFVDLSIPRDFHVGIAYDYLVHGVQDHSDRTFFRAIRQLRGGHCLTVDLAGGSTDPTTRRYWGVDTGASLDGLTDAQYADRFRELLEDSVRLRLRSDVPVGSCLSGGLDSSSIVCIVNRILRVEGEAEKQNTFSSCFEDRRYDERRFIEEVTGATSVNARYVFPDPGRLFGELPAVLRHQDEPFGSTSIYAQWCVFRLARENGVKVMLDGQGADELLGGYHTYFPARIADLLARRQWDGLLDTIRGLRSVHRKTPRELSRMLVSGFVTPRSRLFPVAWRILGHSDRDILAPDFLRAGELESEYAKIPAVKGGSRFAGMLYESFFHTSLPALLHYEDRDSMAHSVESRVPFLDYRLVEFVFSLPDDQKIRGPVTKLVLRNAMGGILPDVVARRTDKVGFVTPEQEWLKGMLREDWIRMSAGLPAKVFDVPRVEEMIRSISSGERPFSFSPWRWLNFGTWWGANAGEGH